jgi:hypothetical protein
VEIDRFENGVPVIKATSEETRHPDGRVDVMIHVPCLNIVSKELLGAEKVMTTIRS